ncbi:MAG TPA: SGNH/GDSL hydrolase family protein [Ornithinicoccus sp.]|nr:SGNH/GDSL hydrolase family protein [Ornithinicoccus sp.]
MTRRLQDLGLVLLAAATAGLVFLAFSNVGDGVRSLPPGAGASHIGGAPAAPTAPADTDQATTAAPDSARETSAADPALAEAREALASADPVVMSVLGDSTSNARQEWVHRWALELSRDRPVTISHWDEAAQGGFVPPDVLSEEGEGSPLTIWSGSQSGANAAYPVQVLSLIVPETPDLVLLNFGHADTSESAAQNFAMLLDAVREGYGDVPVVVVLQQPQVDDANADVRDQIRTWAEGEGLDTIDVAQAFRDSGDVAALLQDDVHPNDAGSRLWAETVDQALGR